MNKGIIVVTGATKGIGRALTEKWLEMGYKVAGCGRDVGDIEELQKTAGSQGSFAVVDVMDAQLVSNWTQSVIDQFGPPSLVFNNAAIINRNALFVELSPVEFDKVIDVNIKGVANVARAFLPAMIRAGEGVLVNLSSGWGRSTSPEVSAYCATKFAIEGLTKSISQELPSGLAAIPLSPNTVNTEMLQSCFGEGAHHSPGPKEWAEVVAPWLLKLGPQQNGQSLSTPA